MNFTKGNKVWLCFGRAVTESAKPCLIKKIVFKHFVSESSHE